jgi:transcriptional antiterminator NusG
MNDIKWYVIKVINGHEKKIKLYLETEILNQNLKNYIIKILIPSQEVYSIRKGKKYVRKKFFFPGYILLYANLFHIKSFNIIKNTSGVLGFLTFKGLKNNFILPQSIRKNEINRILGKIDENKKLEKLINPFILGEIVRVIDGPFIGSTGNIQKIFKERKKINVMLKIFGRTTPIELHYMQVKKTL